jgi:Flp pilus assembly pilin Flp
MADTRGASLVEYALMLFLVLCVAAATITLLGKKTRLVIDSSTEAF